MAADRVLLGLASDAHLAAQVHDGSERAFEVLFERYHRALLAYCRSMVGSADEAEDAVQQTFLAAYRDLVRGRRPDAVRPWLFGIARRRCLALLSDRRARPGDDAPDPAADALLAQVAAREDLRAILSDVKALPEDQRTALVLAELEGFRHDEIAIVLGCRREKVKALVFQARTTLATSRAARDMPCAEVREQLDSLRGAVARRKILRRHMRNCAACQDYRDSAGRGRRAVGLLAPGFGLKGVAIGALLGSGSGGTSVVAAVLVAVALPAGGVAALTVPSRPMRPAARTHAATTPAQAAAAHAPVAVTPVAVTAPHRVLAPAPRARTATGRHWRRHLRRAPAQPRAKGHAPPGRAGKVAVHPRHAATAKRAVRRGRARPRSAPPALAKRHAAPPARVSVRHAARGRRPAIPPGRARVAGTVPASPQGSPPIRSSPSAAHCGCSPSSPSAGR